MASCHPCERRLQKSQRRLLLGQVEAYLLVQLDILHHFETEGEVAKVHMDSQKANDAEATKHSVKGTLAIFADNFTD